MTIDREARAKDAAQLLENPLLVEAFAAIEHEAIEQWVGTGFGGAQDRERAWLFMKIVARVRGGLEAIVTDGKIAARQVVREPMR